MTITWVYSISDTDKRSSTTVKIRYVSSLFVIAGILIELFILDYKPELTNLL